MNNQKAWICNPYKNKTCKRMICGIMDYKNILNPHRCFLTTKKENRLDLIDPSNPDFKDVADRIDRWIELYYGKEEEANGGTIQVERHVEPEHDERDGY